MTSKLQPIRGTHDLLPEWYGGEFEKFESITLLARELATVYGFKEMATPIFEMTDVFARSMGETSDAVSKEMYSFETKGGESVTLRPEFTAGIVRAFLSNGLQQHLPLKLFCTGPLFRYERPQKGRQRQFHQVNYEIIGDASVHADIEAITLAAHLIYFFDRKVTLHINTLGDKESRERYRSVLVEYLQRHETSLSEDSRRRLQLNPLRILDSKNEGDKRIIADAPKMGASLSVASRTRFDAMMNHLQEQAKSHLFPKGGIVVNDTLVRGLDYYTDTVFEFISSDEEMGSQNTVLAGGRYDGLVEHMGGKPVPAIGFAAGIERLMLMYTPEKKPIAPIYLIPIDAEGESAAHLQALVFRSYERSRKTHLQVRAIDILWNGTLGKRIGRAAERGASHVILLGGEELKRNACIVKNLNTGEQAEMSLMPETIQRFIQETA